MTHNIDALERLARLRADGVLTDAEFEAQKSTLLGDGLPATDSNSVGAPKTLGERWAVARQQSSGVRHFFRWFFGLQALAIIVIGAYFLLKFKADGGTWLEQPALATALSGNPAPGAVAMADVASVSPSPEYLGLCVFAAAFPTGWSLREFAAVAAEEGVVLTWEPSGSNWIMRLRLHDAIKGADYDVGYELTKLPKPQENLDCSQLGQDLLIERVSIDGEVLSGPDVTRFIIGYFGPAVVEHQQKHPARGRVAAAPVDLPQNELPTVTSDEVSRDDGVGQDEGLKPEDL